jgi:hypothetical protein
MTDQTQLLREALRARMCASCPITDPEQACCMPDARAALSAPAQPARGEVATVAIDNLHNDRRDGRTDYIWPPVKIGTKLYTAPQPAARVAMTDEQANAIDRAIQLCEWIGETPHQRGSINGLAMQVAHELRGITSNGATDAGVAE